MKRWTEQQIQALRDEYPSTDTYDLVTKLGFSHRAIMVKASELKVKKLKEAKRTWTAHAKLPNDWGFGRGNGAEYSRGKKARNHKPVGSEFVSNKGETFVKVATTGTKNKDWRRKNRVVWEKHNGRALQPNEIVRHANGDTFDFSPHNLVLGSRVDLIHANSLHNHPPQVGDVYRAIGHLRKAINRKKK